LTCLIWTGSYFLAPWQTHRWWRIFERFENSSTDFPWSGIAKWRDHILHDETTWEEFCWNRTPRQ